MHSLQSTRAYCAFVRRESREPSCLGIHCLDFIIIMMAHVLACWSSTMLAAYICLSDKRLHAAMLWIIVMICVFRGAQQYVSWVTSMTSKAVEEEFAELLEELHHQQDVNCRSKGAASSQHKCKQN